MAPLCHGALFYWGLAMAGRITALKVQKKNPDRVNVYLDGRFAFGLAAVEAARLRVGQFLSDEEIAHLRQKDEVERAAERALDLLSYRPRSEAELRSRLGEKYDESALEEALDRLRRGGLVDDREFARYWVENRFHYNPRGKSLLRQELRQKGLEDEVIAEALADYDEEQAAQAAAQKLLRRWKGAAPQLLRRRLTDALLRRGFPYSVVGPIVSEILSRGPTIDFSEEESE